jgi:hypothetical protein
MYKHLDLLPPSSPQMLLFSERATNKRGLALPLPEVYKPTKVEKLLVS